MPYCYDGVHARTLLLTTARAAMPPPLQLAGTRIAIYEFSLNIVLSEVSYLATMLFLWFRALKLNN